MDAKDQRECSGCDPAEGFCATCREKERKARAIVTKTQYHAMTNHEHWPFDTPEDALRFAAEALANGNPVHIYPVLVPA